MVREYGDRFVITEVNDAVPLVTTIESLRREISSSCTGISSKARRLSLTNRNVALRLGGWEEQLNQIRKDTLSTHSLDTLRQLRMRCEAISDQLALHSKR